ncbi:MAG: P-II family nitrogen regulator [Candidatus Omnitrophota bacterium]|nr:P-II family nitrogen regulator [Candidatus Omnitrophota bacterium]
MRTQTPCEETLHLTIRQEMGAPPSSRPGMLRLWGSPPLDRGSRLKEVVAIIRPQRWSQTKLRVQRLRLQAFTETRVLGRGRERGLRYLPRKGAAGGVGVRYLPKRMVSWIVEEAQVEPLVRAIIEANQTGQLGDGKIFVLPLEDAVRIRTGERAIEAVRAQGSFDIIQGTPQVSSASPEVAHAHSTSLTSCRARHSVRGRAMVSERRESNHASRE